jgi:hypothetical protein
VYHRQSEPLIEYYRGRPTFRSIDGAQTPDRVAADLAAAIEAEYRRQRTDLLVGLQWWLRDVWLETLRFGQEMFTYPELAAMVKTVSRRITR